MRSTMTTLSHPEPTVFVIFGAGGDLTLRKLVPALYNLSVDGWMAEKYEILGMGHGDRSDDAFRKRLRKGLARFSRRGKAEKDSWENFVSHIFFVNAELKDKKAYENLDKRHAALEKESFITPRMISHKVLWGRWGF
jgi:glucose-6-phosphate 1-dehydrogenase